ncbi:MAG: hypothetical protein KJ065_26730 [Anaerolineae bacterium]|nr:hypothetical protein [Anaerolineae bacterium]
MASAEAAEHQESIWLPVLIVALGGAIAGGFYGAALMQSDLWSLILPVFGGLAMAVAISLALANARLRLRPIHQLRLIAIWALGSDAILLTFIVLIRSVSSQLAIPTLFLIFMFAGWLTGRGTHGVIERAAGARLEGLFLPAIWAAGFMAYFLSYFVILPVITTIGTDTAARSLPTNTDVLLTSLIGGALAAGAAAWLMFRNLRHALANAIPFQAGDSLNAGQHGALEVVSAPDEQIKGKPKAKRRIDVPVPETPRQWRMVALAGVIVFALAASIFTIFPVRTVTIIVTPPALPSPVPYPTELMLTLPPQGTQMIFPPPTQPLPTGDPSPLYYIGQPVHVANLTPDIANYSQWWVSRYDWLPQEGEWIYEVVTFNNITIVRAENQLSPFTTPTPVPFLTATPAQLQPQPTPTIPISLT